MSDTTGEAATVLVVDDHATLGEALLFALSFEPDIKVIGLAPTVAAAVEMAATSCPDVVLMDVRLPDGNGIDATSRILQLRPGAAVIVLSAHADPLFALKAAEAGASGFVPKDVRIARIVAAVRATRAGTAAVDPTMLRSMLAQAAADGAAGVDTEPAPALPADQVTVLELLARGAGSDGIAARLGVDTGEAAAIVAAAMAALGARSRLEALVRAARLGLLVPTAD